MTEILNIPVESEDLKEFKEKTGMRLADCIKILINSVKYGGKLELEKIIDDINHGRNITQHNLINEKNNSSIEELKSLVQKIFQNNGKFPIISFLEGHEFIFSDYSSLSDLDKSLVLKIICKGKYQENQIAYMQLTEDLSSGFAFTIDSLCIGGNIGNKIFPYSDIIKVEIDYGSDIKIFVDYEKYKETIEKEKYDKIGWYNEPSWYYVFRGISSKIEFTEGIKKFLDVVKNF